MPVQTTYNVNPDPGYPGMVADASLKDVASKVVENAPVAFGLAVGAGTADGSVRLGGTGFEGIAVADKTRLAEAFAVDEMAGVMRKGTIWVTASTNVSPADPVTFTAATGVIGAGLATAITNAKFLDTATSGNLVRVYLG